MLFSLPARLSAAAYTLPASLLALALAGCAAGKLSSPTVTPLPAAFKGVLHGGQSPIQNATVTFYITNPAATTYGAAPTESVSTSSLADGTFTLATSGLTCAAGQQAYITAAGGYQANTPANLNTSMLQMAAIGDCTTITASTNVVINELTSVAAAYALSGFMTTSLNATTNLYQANVSAPVANSSAIGSATATAPSGLAHAFLNAANLVNSSNGYVNTYVFATSANTQVEGQVPYVELNTLADVMQSCIDGATGNASCTSLFGFTPSISGVAPVNTLQAFVNLARNPYPSAAAFNTTTGLQSLASATPAFQPTLTNTPGDYSLVIVWGKGQFPTPYWDALDLNDNFYFGQASPTANVTNSPSILGVSAYGSTIPLFSSLSAGSATRGVAPDALGNIFVTNNSANTERLSITSGARLSIYASATGSSYGLAVDAQNNVWIGHTGVSPAINVEELAAGSYTTRAFGTSVTNGPYGISIDASQNIWPAGYTGTNTLAQLVPNNGTVASPTYGTPIYTTLSSSANSPYSVVFDTSGNGWNAITYVGSAHNTTASTGVEPVSPNTLLAATSLSAGTFVPGTTAGNKSNTLGTQATQMMAIDGAGTIFIPDNNTSSNGIHMFSTQLSGAAAVLSSTAGLKGCLTPTGGTACQTTTAASVYNPRQVAIDSTGSAWTTLTSGGVTQIIGIAAPSYPLLSVGKPSLSPGLTTVNPLPDQAEPTEVRAPSQSASSIEVGFLFVKPQS